MASTSESGHDKNVANFKTLIIDCQSYGATYNPSNTNIMLPALQTVYTNGYNILIDVGTKDNTVEHVINTRDVVFEPLKHLATQVMGALEASGANPQTMLNAKTINRKIQGSRAGKKASTSSAGGTSTSTPTGSTPAPTPTGGGATSNIPTPAPASQKVIGTPIALPTPINISVSQQSFDKLVSAFVQLVDYVAQYPNYNPNETNLKIAALQNSSAGFLTANNNVKTAQASLDISIANRTKTLYDPTTGLVQLTKEVKAYVKSAFGASSPQYKQIKAIPFKTIVTRSHKKKK